MVHPTIDLARESMPKLKRLMSAVGTALHRAMGNNPKCNWRHSTLALLPLGVLKNMTVRTTLITVVMSLPKMSQGQWPEENPCAISKTIPCMLLLII